MAELKQKQLQLAAVEAELKVIQMELEDKNRQLKVSIHRCFISMVLSTENHF